MQATNKNKAHTAPPAQARQKASNTTPDLGNKLQAAAQAAENGNQLPAPTEDPSLQFRTFLEKHERDFAMVVPSHIKPDRIIRLGISAMRRNPQLMTCTIPSVVGGLLQGASLGFEVNSPLEQAYLVPFKNKKTGKREAEFIIGYKGYIDLFYRSGMIDTIFAQPIFENDNFSYEYGTSEFLKHKPDGDPATRGKPVKFYSYARIRGTAYRFIILDVAEVNKIRDDFSASYRNDPQNAELPWNKNYLQMGCKTAVRALEPYLPRSAETNKAAMATDGQVIDSPFDPANFDFATEGGQK